MWSEGLGGVVCVVKAWEVCVCSEGLGGVGV